MKYQNSLKVVGNKYTSLCQQIGVLAVAPTMQQRKIFEASLYLLGIAALYSGTLHDVIAQSSGGQSNVGVGVGFSNGNVGVGFGVTSGSGGTSFGGGVVIGGNGGSGGFGFGSGGGFGGFGGGSGAGFVDAAPIPSGDPGANVLRLEQVLQKIFTYMEGSFGALVMVASGIGAIFASAFGQFKAALGLLVVAIGAFILRSLVTTFFTTFV